MSEEIQTFTFEGHYDDDGGNRCDVVRAYSREQALRICAIDMIESNEWTTNPGYDLTKITDLADFYEECVEINAEWGDLKGTACPNCTSHGGRPNGNHIEIDGAQREVHDCSACQFQWIPLARNSICSDPTSEALDKIIEDWMDQHVHWDDSVIPGPAISEALEGAMS